MPMPPHHPLYELGQTQDAMLALIFGVFGEKIERTMRAIAPDPTTIVTPAIGERLMEALEGDLRAIYGTHPGDPRGILLSLIRKDAYIANAAPYERRLVEGVYETGGGGATTRLILETYDELDPVDYGHVRSGIGDEGGETV